MPSTSVDGIISFDLSRIRRIIFIENKTNYDEFILSELRPDELAVYHGGFFSPQKRKFLRKSRHPCKKRFQFLWADIDLADFKCLIVYK
ncbi:MAG: Wadjet anti-phage system protein JetD domain-containing protein [Evtepia gabavorous]